MSLRKTLLWSSAFLATLAVASLDTASRARAAYRRAERMEALARSPKERDAAVEKAFLSGVAALDRRRPAPAERELEVEILRKRWEEERLRSPWTDAYHAWRNVQELHAPPETAWSRRARLLAPAARQKWREEWTARRLPFNETLLDLEPGEEGGQRLLFSVADPDEASRVMTLFQTLEIPVRMLLPAAGALPPARAARFLVPEERFWEAHQALRPLVGLDEN